jgi:dCMP deaminase
VERPDIDTYMMGMALMAASRATCVRRSVGCILTNKRHHIVATGYNGVPRGFAHCGTLMCPGSTAPSGTQLEGCMATHAEQNALLQCTDVESIETCYCTTAPCITCTKLLLNTGCQNIVFLHDYPGDIAKGMWIDAGKTWHQLPTSKVQLLTELFRAQAERSESALTMSR